MEKFPNSNKRSDGIREHGGKLKNDNQLVNSNGFIQLISEPTKTMDAIESLLDHILVNTPDKISQSGVIKKPFLTMKLYFVPESTKNLNLVSIIPLKSGR